MNKAIHVDAIPDLSYWEVHALGSTIGLLYHHCRGRMRKAVARWNAGEAEYICTECGSLHADSVETGDVLTALDVHQQDYVGGLI